MTDFKKCIKVDLFPFFIIVNRMNSKTTKYLEIKLKTKLDKNFFDMEDTFIELKEHIYENLEHKLEAYDK